MKKINNASTQLIIPIQINNFNKTTNRKWFVENSKILKLKEEKKELSEFTQAKSSHSLKGKTSIFASNSFQGRFRNYNEDRIVIESNVPKPFGKILASSWPRIDYFAIFDGHGGYKCSEYLKSNLLSFIINEVTFPNNPIHAIKSAFVKIDSYLLKQAIASYETDHFDTSGSCALVILIIRDLCYCINVGDSRSLYSENFSHKVDQISIEHKPNTPEEKERIVLAGGSLFRTESFDANEETITWRILPGQLAVSRSFGDIEAKFARFGGNPNVLISTPDITSFQISYKADFIVLGSDGIFDYLSNKDIIKHIWKVKSEKEKIPNYSNKKLISEITDSLITRAMNEGSNDNVSCIFITFSNFFRTRINHLSPLKYIDQVNCDQTLLKRNSITKEKGDFSPVNRFLCRMSKKPRTNIAFNLGISKYTLDTKSKTKEDTLILNSSQNQKVSVSLPKKNYILPEVKTRLKHL